MMTTELWALRLIEKCRHEYKLCCNFLVRVSREASTNVSLVAMERTLEAMEATVGDRRLSLERRSQRLHELGETFVKHAEDVKSFCEEWRPRFD